MELSRLTGLLLQAPHAFLQTFYPDGRIDIDIFAAQQQLLHLVLQPAEPLQQQVILHVSSAPQATPTAATLALVQALSQLWPPASLAEP